MQLSTSSTRWHLLSIFTLLWFDAAAVQQSLAEEKVKTLMRRERRRPRTSPPPTSMNASEPVAAKQPLLVKEVKKLMRRERRRSGTSPERATNSLELPLSPERHPKASQKSDASSHTTPGHLGDARLHAAATRTISTPVDKSVPEHMNKPVPPATVAEKGYSVSTSVHLDKNVGSPPKQVMTSSWGTLHELGNIAVDRHGNSSKMQVDASSGKHDTDQTRNLHLDENSTWGRDSKPNSENSTDVERLGVRVMLINVGLVIVLVFAGLVSWGYSQYKVYQSRQAEINKLWNEANDRG